MEFIATQKFVKVSPIKLRVVVSMVKKLSPVDAVEKLPFAKKGSSVYLQKVVQTAIANAKQKGVSDKDLAFKEIQISEGPRLKRWKAGARGRAKPYVRKMSHIKVILISKEPEVVQKAQKDIKEEKEVEKIESEKVEKLVKKETKKKGAK